MLDNQEISEKSISMEEDKEGSTQNYSIKRKKFKIKLPGKARKKLNRSMFLVLTLAIAMFGSNLAIGLINSKATYELGQKAATVQNGNSTISNAKLGSNSQISTSNIALAKNSAITEIAKLVGPSVVGIRMTTTKSTNNFLSSNESVSEGSGIIISDDGYIMTNYHVVSNSDPKNNLSKYTTVEVFLSDNRQAKATFVGGDVINDLAVVKISLTNLPVAELGDSSKLEVGETAVAIGNPMGIDFAGTVTAGIISSVNRKIDTSEKTLSFIQTDAAINPGNSGGALVNSQGQVIGINSLKISEAGVEGMGFAIPINDAKPIVDQLIMFGYVKGRPLLGVTGTEITQTMSKRYKLPVGLYVTSVAKDSGAEKAGIKKGDVVTSLADKPVASMVDINNVKDSYKSGDTVNILVVRSGKTMNLKLTFTEQK